MRNTDKGKIKWNRKWKLTKSGKVAVRRLAELGVSVLTDGEIDENHVYFQIPHCDIDKLDFRIYLEIGYLIAQIGDVSFPDDFAYGISPVPSDLFRSNRGYRTIHCGANPGHKYVILRLS
jgi:hypothetical protein